MKPTRLQIEHYRYRVYRWYVLAQRIKRIAREMEKMLIEMEKAISSPVHPPEN